MSKSKNPLIPSVSKANPLNEFVPRRKKQDKEFVPNPEKQRATDLIKNSDDFKREYLQRVTEIYRDISEQSKDFQSSSIDHNEFDKLIESRIATNNGKRNILSNLTGNIKDLQIKKIREFRTLAVTVNELTGQDLQLYQAYIKELDTLRKEAGFTHPKANLFLFEEIRKELNKENVNFGSTYIQYEQIFILEHLLKNFKDTKDLQFSDPTVIANINECTLAFLNDDISAEVRSSLPPSTHYYRHDQLEFHKTILQVTQKRIEKHFGKYLRSLNEKKYQHAMSYGVARLGDKSNIEGRIIVSLQENEKRLLKKLRSNQIEIDALKSQCEDSLNMTLLQASIEKLSKENGDLQKRLAVVQNDATTYVANVKDLTKEADEMRARINEQEATITEYETKEIESKTQLENFKKQARQANEDAAIASRAAQKALDEKKEEIENLQQKYSTANKKIFDELDQSFSSGYYDETEANNSVIEEANNSVIEEANNSDEKEDEANDNFHKCKSIHQESIAAAATADKEAKQAEEKAIDAEEACYQAEEEAKRLKARVSNFSEVSGSVDSKESLEKAVEEAQTKAEDANKKAKAAREHASITSSKAKEAKSRVTLAANDLVSAEGELINVKGNNSSTKKSLENALQHTSRKIKEIEQTKVTVKYKIQQIVTASSNYKTEGDGQSDNNQDNDSENQIRRKIYEAQLTHLDLQGNALLSKQVAITTCIATHEAKKKYREAKSELQNRTYSIAELKQKHDEKTAEIQEVRSLLFVEQQAHIGTKAILSEVESELANVKSSLEIAQQDKKSKEQEVITLKAQLEESNRTSSSQLEEIEEKDRTILELQGFINNHVHDNNELLVKLQGELTVAIKEKDDLLKKQYEQAKHTLILSQQIDSLANSVISKDQEIENLDKLVQNYYKTIVKLRNRNIELTEELAQAKAENEQLRACLEATGKDLNSAKIEIIELKEAKRKIEDERDEAIKNLHEANENLSRKVASGNEHTLEIAKLKQEQENLKAIINGLTIELEKKNNLIQEKDSTILKLEKENQKLRDKILEFQEAKELLKIKILELSQQISDKNATIEGNKLKIMEFEVKLQSLITEGDKQNGEISNLRSQIRDLKDQNSIIDLEKNRLEQENSVLKETLADRETMIKEINAQNLQLEDQIKEKNDKIKEKEKAVEQQKAQIQQQQITILQLEEEKQTLVEELFNLKNKQEDQKVESESRINELLSLIKEKEQNITNNQRSVKTLQEELDNSKKIIKQQEQEINRLNQVVSALKEQLSEKDRLIADLNDRLEILQRQSKASEKKIIMLINKLSKLQQEKDLLKGSLDDIKSNSILSKQQQEILIDNFKSIIEEKEQESIRNQAELKKLQIENDEIRENFRLAKAAIEHLTATIENITSRSKILTAELAESNSENNILKKEKAELEEKNKQLVELKNLLEKKIKDSTENNQELQLELDFVENALQKVKKELEEKTTKVVEAEKNILNLHVELDKLNELLRVEKGANIILRINMNKLKEKLKAAEIQKEKAVTDIAALKEDIDYKKAENDGLKKELTASQDEIKNLNSQQEQLIVNIDLNNNKIKSLEEENEKNKRKIEELLENKLENQEEIDNLQKKFENSKKETEDLLLANDNLQKELYENLRIIKEKNLKIIELEKEIASLNNQLLKQQRDINELQEKISVLEKKQEASESKVVELTSQLKIELEEKHNLEQELFRLQRELAVSNTKNEEAIKQLQDNLNKNNKKITELEMTLESVTTELDEAKNKLFEAQRTINDLNEELKQEKEKNRQLEEEKAAAILVAQILEKNLNEVKTENQTLTEKIFTQDSSIEELTRRNTTMEEERNSLTIDLKATQEKLIETNNVLKEQQDNLRDLQGKYDEKEKGLNLASKENKELNNINQILKKEISELIQQKSALELDYKNIQEILEKKQSSILQLQDTLSTHEASINNYKIITRLQLELIEEGKGKVQGLEMELDSLRGNNEELIKKIRTLNEELDELRQQNTEFSKKYHQLELEFVSLKDQIMEKTRLNEELSLANVDFINQKTKLLEEKRNLLEQVERLADGKSILESNYQIQMKNIDQTLQEKDEIININKEKISQLILDTEKLQKNLIEKDKIMKEQEFSYKENKKKLLEINQELTKTNDKLKEDHAKELEKRNKVEGELKQYIKSLENQHDDNIKLIGVFKQKIVELNDRLTVTVQKNNQLLVQLEAVKQTLKNKSQEYNRAISSLQLQLNEAKNNPSSLEQIRNQLEQQMEKYIDQKAKFEESLREICRENLNITKDYTDKIKTLQEQLEKQKSLVEAVQIEKQEITKKMDELQEDSFTTKNELQVKLQEVEARLINYRNDLEHTKNDLTTSNNQLSQTKDEALKISNELDKLNKEMVDLRRKNDEILRAKDNTTEELKKQLQQSINDHLILENVHITLQEEFTGYIASSSGHYKPIEGHNKREKQHKSKELVDKIIELTPEDKEQMTNIVDSLFDQNTEDKESFKEILHKTGEQLITGLRDQKMKIEKIKVSNLAAKRKKESILNKIENFLKNMQPTNLPKQSPILTPEDKDEMLIFASSLFGNNEVAQESFKEILHKTGEQLITGLQDQKMKIEQIKVNNIALKRKKEGILNKIENFLKNMQPTNLPKQSPILTPEDKDKMLIFATSLFSNNEADQASFKETLNKTGEQLIKGLQDQKIKIEQIKVNSIASKRTKEGMLDKIENFLKNMQLTTSLQQPLILSTDFTSKKLSVVNEGKKEGEKELTDELEKLKEVVAEVFGRNSNLLQFNGDNFIDKLEGEIQKKFEQRDNIHYLNLLKIQSLINKVKEQPSSKKTKTLTS